MYKRVSSSPNVYAKTAAMTECHNISVSQKKVLNKYPEKVIQFNVLCLQHCCGVVVPKIILSHYFNTEIQIEYILVPEYISWNFGTSIWLSTN